MGEPLIRETGKTNSGGVVGGEIPEPIDIEYVQKLPRSSTGQAVRTSHLTAEEREGGMNLASSLNLIICKQLLWALGESSD